MFIETASLTVLGSSVRGTLGNLQQGTAFNSGYKEIF